MINQVRTLLMNKSSIGGSSSFPGEEFIPPDFVPKKWPADLTRAMSTLLGARPDRLYLNYRMREIMAILHNTELAEYVYKNDPRVTYLPLNDEQFFGNTVFGTTYDQYEGNVEVPLTVHGEHVSDEGNGTTTLQWQITVVDGTQVEVKRLTPPPDTKLVTYTNSNGLSTYVPLHGSGLKIKFPTASGVGTSWMLYSRARPEMALSVRAENMMGLLTDQLLLRMFPSRNEPWATLKNTYEDNPLFPYKFSAVMLALAFYMDTLPQEA